MSEPYIDRKTALKTLAGVAAFAVTIDPEPAPATWPAVGKPGTVQHVLQELAANTFSSAKACGLTRAPVHGKTGTIHYPAEAAPPGQSYNPARNQQVTDWDGVVRVLDELIARIETRDQSDPDWEWLPPNRACSILRSPHAKPHP